MADPIDTSAAVDAYLGEAPSRLGAQARYTMTQAVGGKPDYEAELQAVAKRTGVPVDTVRAYPDDMKKQATLGAYDFDRMAVEFPNTAKFLAVPEQAAVAHDDTPVLANIEQGFRYFVSAPGKSSTLGGDAKAAYFSANSGAAGAFGAAARVLGAPLDFLESYPATGGNPFRRLSEGFLSIADADAAKAKAAQGKSSTWLGGAVSSGVQSLAQNLPTMAAALLPGGQPAALAGMGAMSGGQTYQKDMAGGTSPNMSLLHALSDATIEVGTEMGPMAGLVKELKAGSSTLSTVLKNAWAENKGEQVATALQDLNDWAVNDVNKGKTFGDYLKARPEAAAQTAIATLIGAGGNVAILQSAQGAADRMAGYDRSAQVAEHHAQTLEVLQKTAEASKLVERSPDTLRSYLQSIADEGVPTVFVDSAKLVESGVDLQALARALPSVASQLEQADTGGDLAIPTSELLVNSIGTEFAQPLMEHARTSADAMSRAEAKVYMQEQGDQLHAEIERVLTDKANDLQFKADRDAVQATLQRQLDAVKRFTPAVNQHYASLTANFYAVMAARTGMGVQQFADTYQLGFAGQAGVGAQVLDQSSPAFSNWFGKSRVTDAGGKPLVVYHGTADSFDAFDRQQGGKNVKTAASKTGLFFTDRADIAGRYATMREGAANIMPVYLSLQNPTRASFSNMVEADKFLAAGFEGDGAIIEVTTPQGKKSTVYAVKDATQVKSATGNNGNYDPANPSVLEQPAYHGSPVTAAERTEYLQSNTAPAKAGQAQAATKNIARGQISFADDITRQASVIAMLKGADLSTFIHESGHFFLEVQADLAARIEARVAQGEAVSEGERSILADMNALLGWMGVHGAPERSAIGEWLALPLEEKRPHHEAFARGFEAYAFEGKAPSLDLQKTFQTFRAWLVNVYRSLLKSVNASKTDIGQALQVELTPEVRSVLDRMLATSDQIAEAEAARGMGPLFRSAEQAGMTADEYKAYHDQGVQATLDAVDSLQAKGLKDMQWLQNARSRKLKELQKQHDVLRAGVAMQVRSEVLAQPIYRAWTFLTAKAGEQVIPGVTPIAAIDTTQAAGKLRTQVLRDMYGTADDALWRTVSSLRMTSDETGMHPDIVAELFGFSSGDELVRALTDAEPPKSVIEGMTDQRMLQEHGDLASPAGLERAADMAIHNDTRARFVATELGALQRAMNVREKVPGQRNTVDVLARAAREYANATVAKLKVRDVRPGQYAAAEVRSARAAQKAVGDIVQATLHKRNQLINMYAAKAAYAAQEDVKKAVAYFKKFDAIGKTLDPEYAEQIHALLERFDLRQGVTLKALDKRASLVEWVQSQVEQGLEPDIAPGLLQEANRKSFKDMTVEEVRGLRDAVAQIEHLGKLKNRLLTAQANRDFAEVVGEITASIDLHAGDRQADTRTPNTLPAQALLALRNFWASHIKAATWARVMDGGKDGGPVWEYLIRTANTAGDTEVVAREKATKELAALAAPVLAQGKMGGKGVYFPTLGRSLNHEAKIAIALNLGNASNQQRLLGGEGWSIEQVRPVLDTLTQADWTFVQAVWDHFESYRPAIGAKEKRVYGKEPNWVEPTPVQTPFGLLRGGYYPVKYDPRASERAESHAQAEDAKRQLAGAYTSATTRRSFTKARVEEVNGRPLLLSMDGIYNGVQEVIHDLAWHEWLIDANKLVKNKGIAHAMREKYGPDAHQQFKKWLEDNATGERGAQDAGERAASWVRQGVSVSGLGLNVMSALMQPLGLTQSIVRIGPKWVGKGISKALGSPLETVDEINGKSEFMRTRALTRLREIAEVRSQVKGRSKAREVVDASAYFLMMRAQQLVDVPTWWGAYEKAIAEGNDEARAVALSDQAVIDSQGSGGTKDQSAIERGGPFGKLFTTFYSFFNTAFNLGVGQTMTQGNKAKLAADYLLLFTVPAIFGAALKDAMTAGDSGDWDDPEKLLKKLVGEQLGFLFGLMVGVREMAGAAQALTGTAQYSTDYSGPAGVRFLADAVKLAKQLHQGELDDGLRKAVINTAGELLRLPSAQVNRTITGFNALADGKTQNPGALLTGYQEPR
jgi:Large polyvalent protein associated domain 22/ADP-Ribosyltransferase in polyvalent proteins